MKKLLLLGFFIVSTCSITLFGQKLSPEQQKIKQTFFDFLHFYQKNAKKFNSFLLYKGTGKENNPPYKIQWKEAEKYFLFLRKQVPFVGETYIKNERAHFKFYDSCYKADPEEEIAVGFDFDRWAGGQDNVEYLVKWNTSTKNKYSVEINGNKALLKIGSPLWEKTANPEYAWSIVPFIKEKGKWKMADNIYPEEEPENSDAKE